MRYKLKAPFMTRKGQFYKDRQTLVCGVMENVILTSKPEEILEVTMGQSPTIYTMKIEQLRQVMHTIWTNPKGIRVWIIPVEQFNAAHIPLPPVEPKIETKKLF